jgi:hypothetical protein
MRFVESRPDGKWSQAVNTHIDVDGILSVFVVMYPALALQNRAAIIAAAEMGDFWGWGDQQAQVLFQGLTLLIDEFALGKTDPYEVYSECLRRVPGMLEGRDPLCKTALLDLQPLRDSVALIESAAVDRTTAGDRFVHYTIPADVARGRLSQALYVPKFNEAISPACLMWPQARNRRDAQRIQLVSVETIDGWQHALWYPGYLWADTENLWRPPGTSLTGGMERYELNLPPLHEAVIELQRREQGGRRWQLCDVLQPFHETAGKDFPVVLRLVNEQGQPVPSDLTPDTIMSVVGPAFRAPASSRRSS